MTNPLPESAVELAALGLANHVKNAGELDDESLARAALEAALPAIREAVVGEFKALVPGFVQETSERAKGRNEVVKEIRTALAEQENRNDVLP